jgi:PAS domain S-box-containing protein
MILARLKNLLIGSLRKQLMVGMALVITLVMVVFVWNMVSQQQTDETKSQTRQITALANSSSTSLAVWVASRDYSGLQEIVEGIAQYPNLLDIIVLDLEGRVLAHNDRSKIGLYLNDMPLTQEKTTLHYTTNTIDALSPVMLAGRQVGAVRLVLDRSYSVAEQRKLIQRGLIYTLIGIVFSVVVALLSGRFLTRRLYAIQQVADAFQAGHSDSRVVMRGNDEAANLALQFNKMLDSLALRAAALKSSEERWKFAIDGSGSGLWDWDMPGNTVFFSKRWKEMIGYAEDELGSDLEEFSSRLHPDDKDRTFATLQQCIEGKTPVYLCEYRFRHKDGHYIWMVEMQTGIQFA